MAWQPNAGGLEELLACLRSSGSPDTKVQESVNEVRSSAALTLAYKDAEELARLRSTRPG
jgi:hypothetical protein